jgi:hypothetical protein
MNAIPLTTDERIQALARFGYSDREAGFLCLAALHGGFFLRRQYGRYLRKELGGTAAALIDKVLAHEHARASTFADNTHVYHLCARPFYEALGQGNNRNRRERQPLSVKNRLMALDVVLAHPGNRFLATEQEKVDFFTTSLKLDPHLLPVKRFHARRDGSVTERYFVDKQPIFLTADGPTGSRPSSQPSVSFCFVDEGARTVSRFETYLDQYRSLLAALPEFRVLYVAQTPFLFESAARAFERLLGATGKGSRVATAPDGARLKEYFAARHLFENGDLSTFDRAKLIRLREARTAFSGAHFEALFEQWKASDHSLPADVSRSTFIDTGAIHGSFSTLLSEHRYDLFGSLTAF